MKTYYPNGISEDLPYIVVDMLNQFCVQEKITDDNGTITFSTGDHSKFETSISSIIRRRLKVS